VSHEEVDIACVDLRPLSNDYEFSQGRKKNRSRGRRRRRGSGEIAAVDCNAEAYQPEALAQNGEHYTNPEAVPLKRQVNQIVPVEWHKMAEGELGTLMSVVLQRRVRAHKLGDLSSAQGSTPLPLNMRGDMLRTIIYTISI
jgi:hypothetical protein